MDLIGTGIPDAIRVKIRPDFQPVTTYALQWVQAASGKWFATDRGAASDVYSTRVTVRGREKELDDLISAVNNNRLADSNVLTLSNFASNEHIFGEDIDYDSVDVTITEMSARNQVSLYVFEYDIYMQALSPSFVGSATGSVTFDNIDHEYSAYSTKTVTKYDTFTGSFTYIDYRSDTGYFEGSAYLTLEDFKTFRRNLATYRGAAISTTITGLNNPFGPTKETVWPTVWPRNLVYLEVEDLGYWGLNYKRVRIRAAEDI